MRSGYVACLLVLCVVTLSGCGSLHAYHRYNSHDGHSDTPLPGGTHEVLFVGNRHMNKTQVKYYAIIRCAELVLLNHREYFEIVKMKETTKVHSEAVSDSQSVTRENKQPTYRRGEEKVTTRVSESSDRFLQYEIPSCRIEFKQVDAATRKSFDAKLLLNRAHLDGVPLSPPVLAALGLPPPE